MNKNIATKKLITRQETINLYKSQSKSYASTPSQVFGLVPETIFLKPQFTPKVIQWITPYNLYAASDEKCLYLFDKSGKIKNSLNFFDAFHISACLTFTYIEKYHCFAFISSDLKLLLVSVLLDLWKSVSLPGRINHIDYCSGFLFLGGTSKISVINLQCIATYEIEKSLLLDPDRGFVNFKTEISKDLSLNIKWIKGMRSFKDFEVLLAWSECKVIVVSIATCQIRAEGEDLCPGTLMTEVVYYGPQDYIVAATSQGSVYVYKLGSTFRLVHVFQGHTRSVPAIVCVGNSYFATASMDYTVKIWSLEHFRILYTFEIPVSNSPIHFLNFLDQTTLAYTNNAQLNIAHLNLIGKLVFISVSSVKSLKIIDEKIAAVGEDNSIVLYEYGKVVTTIYPPPSAHDLKDIIYIDAQRRVLVLLDSGVICLFSIERETGLLERMIRTGEITDSEARPVASPVVCIKQVDCVPPQYDSELVFRKHSEQEMKDSKFIAMSAGKGTLIFVTIDKIDRVYSRFSMHRETIIAIEEITGYIITMCSANSIIVSAFRDNQLVKFKKIEIKSQVSYLRALQPDRFLIAFATGQIEILQVQESGLSKLVNKDLEIDAQLTSVDIVQEEGTLAMASTNNLIQVWNFEKQLLHEIKFPHPISSIMLVNENMYVSYKQVTVSVKIHKLFTPGVTEYEDIDEDYFKFMYTYQVSDSDKSLTPREREKTPERLNISALIVETRGKFRSEMASRKKKIAPKKSKKKRANATKSASKNRPVISRDPEQELYVKIISRKIPVISSTRPISHNALLTRRQLTEEKIIENVKRYGDPADRIDYSGLCVVDESLYYEELAKLRGSNSIL